MSKLEPVVRDVGLQIQEHLFAIQDLFKPGKLLTLIIRDPESDQRSLVMTIDNDAEVIAFLSRFKAAQEEKL